MTIWKNRINPYTIYKLILLLNLDAWLANLNLASQTTGTVQTSFPQWWILKLMRMKMIWLVTYKLPRCTPSGCWGCYIPRWGCSLRRTRSSGGSSSSARGRWSPAPRTSWSVPSGSAACTRRGPGSTHYQWVILTKHLYTDDEDRRLVSLSLILVRSNSLSLNSLSIELTAKYEKCEFDQTNFFLFFFQFWPGG